MLLATIEGQWTPIDIVWVLAGIIAVFGLGIQFYRQQRQSTSLNRPYPLGTLVQVVVAFVVGCVVPFVLNEMDLHATIDPDNPGPEDTIHV